MDEMVLAVQKWLNDTYTGKSGFSPVPEDGETGNTTVGALIIGLQIELGISNPVPTFGPATSREFPGLERQEDGAEPNNMIKILQGGFWCKGYNPGGFSGNFFGGTEDKVKDFENDVGIEPTGFVSSKLMKAILNTDGFVLSTSNGRQNVREVQQSLNKEYSNYFDYIPTNGIYERKSNKALIYALQHEEGIGNIANGNFGPSTIENCPTLSYGNAPTKFTRILQWSLACNSPLYDTHPYDGDFDPQVETAINLFKEFMTLPVDGVADMPTIKQLLTSNGYTGRSAIACDASTVINQTTTNTLLDYNYQVIGRYLTGYVGTGADRRSKAMTHEELNILAVNGIRVFPIYQDGGYYAEYFVPGRGTEDAWKAIRAANELGFPSGTTIYFAVDYDAYDFEVTNNILPYLAEVRAVLDVIKGGDLPEYKLGVYGSRNTCIRAQSNNSVLADYSFVGNMSTGFSGNLGYTMPSNWSFNQFHETSIGSGLGVLGIDKNDYSGKDTGVSAVNPPDDPEISKEYEAKHNAFVEMGKNIPGLQLFGPELFATNINFNHTHRIAEIANLASIDVEFSEQLNPPSDGGTTATLQVTNDGVNGSLESLLGESMAQFTQKRLGFYEDFIDNMAASIGTGSIQLSLTGSGTNAELRVTAFKEEIPVEGGGNLQLAVTVIFTVDIDLTPVLDAFSSKEVKAAATTLGFVFLLYLAVMHGIPVIATLGVGTIVALLIGNEDDIDDNES
ncbi:glycoside hydrolase domain-containing protein [Virgibacillus salexigens]|uniref:DUF1906 domain-containing protein n=1 Tax=Virgibacillus kapii TaxID=1638645 RepID=A0ABQ2DYK1_9BACI|nr:MULTISPECIES: glycoside hydrolase domain-containing protein [Virgibacillus]MYL43931.1 DUF1906 domain-containing protein [Virgibacillus massiliensis]GGJ76996.1 hypothetical protein GCM10007111_43320 [Virgibacillus kapii]